MKVRSLAASDAGPVLISADIHGNYADFDRLRAIFLASVERGERPWWISVGDWVHGPTPDRHPILDDEGVPLYDYPDETPRILTELFALMDRFPEVHSITGNHEHAHIGGMRTSKFHRDEAGYLESICAPALVAELRARFAAWPMIIRLPSCGVVIAHGAPVPGTAAEFDAIDYGGNETARAWELVRAAMTRYGFDKGEDVALLAALSDDATYRILLHGHDREELGHCPTGEAALLLCTSFGARRAYKTYAWLDRGTRYDSLADLRAGHELRRLWE